MLIGGSLPEVVYFAPLTGKISNQGEPARWHDQAGQHVSMHIDMRVLCIFVCVCTCGIRVYTMCTSTSMCVSLSVYQFVYSTVYYMCVKVRVWWFVCLSILTNSFLCPFQSSHK